MRAVFLAHSGFLIELDTVSLLFDWWQGDLPALPDKPLLVFASHAHHDHFDPKIFTLDGPGTRFLLGKDIRLSPRNVETWGLAPETVERCLRLGGSETARPLPGVTVETLPSTDEGVAFLVTAEGKTIFHAGDLNWWHWAGEDKAWNNNMAANFQRYIQPLRGRKLDLAMLPLDPRLNEDGYLGPKTFLETAEIARFLPMHQWEDFGFTEKFLETCPQFRGVTIPIRRTGQEIPLD